MKKFSLLFSLLLFCCIAFSQSIYLDAGPAVSADEPEGQPVLSYSLGVQEINITLVTGSMSPELFQAAAQGTRFAKMELDFYDNQNKIYQTITIRDVYVTSIQVGTDLTEYVTLSYSKMKTKNFSN
jgi:type VI protein secretion system component Hcp